MSHVGPDTASVRAASSSSQAKAHSLWPVLASLVYLLVTAASSIYFLVVARPTLANDMFWRDFSLFGAQSYILNAVNQELGRHPGTAQVSLVGPVNWASLQHRYNQPSVTSIEVKPTAVRRVVLTDPTMLSLESAISSLQRVSAEFSVFLLTQYCWVDFEKRWELAHTAVRAQRCKLQPQFHANGAAYLETLLRSIDWASFMQKWGTLFTGPILQYVNSTAEGPAWLGRTIYGFRDIPIEAAFWRRFGVTHYRLNWGNSQQAAFADTLVVENALGHTQTLTLSRIPSKNRGSLWTSIHLYWAFVNDLWFAETQARASAVRQAPNFVTKATNMTFEDGLPIYPSTPVSIFLHDSIGPLLSIDTFLVAPPATLVAFVAEFEKFLVTTMSANANALETFQMLPSATLDPAPELWRQRHAVYYGGSPLCAFNRGAPFVQPQFSFDDPCGSETPSSMAVTPAMVTFAIAAFASTSFGSTSDACTLCATTAGLCQSAVAASGAWLASVAAAPPTMASMAQAAMADVVEMNVELVQYTSVRSHNIVLRHLVLSPASVSIQLFNLFGWMQVMEWAQGYRECVSFQGDVAAFVLLSERVAPMHIQASPLEVPAFSCMYLWYIAVSTSIAVVLLVAMTLVYACLDGLSALQWSHFLVFNRVAGPVWIGRPMLLIRALVALVVLSSAPLNFATSVGGSGLSRLEFRPRQVGDSWVLAGEATWLTYVANDVLQVVASPVVSKWGAPLSSALVWVMTFALDVASPIALRSTLSRVCTTVNVEYDVTCISGVVAIGDVNRIYTIALVNAACLGASYLLVALLQRRRRTATVAASTETPLTVPYSIYASGVTFLRSASPPGMTLWTVPSPVAAMCGLLPFTFRGRGYVFDTKLWVVFSTGDDSYTPEAKCLLKSSQSPKTFKSEAKDGPNVRAPAASSSKVVLVFGLQYVVGTLVGSYSYLVLAHDRFGNDFWWEHFNSSGTHTFLSNLFNQELFYMTPMSTRSGIHLHESKFSSWGNYASGKEVVSSSVFYPRHVMASEGGTVLSIAIQGLRRTDPCLLPWIATQFCWLDFDRKWDMANSAARQARCQTTSALVTNGAVFVEAVLRNTQWAAFSTCWGAAFDAAIAQDLQRESAGQTWLATIQGGPSTSIVDEVAHWTQVGIVQFTTQWQNYKTLGLIDKLDVQNAFGLSFPLTLKASNASFRLSFQTSLKMYWTWAGDLGGVTGGSPLMANRSLLRSSPRFAFQASNATMEQAVLTNSTYLQAPLGAAYRLFRDTIGPFGSVDLLYIAYPPSLARLHEFVAEAIAVAIATPSMNATYPAQEGLQHAPGLSQFVAVPLEWNASVHRTHGGNILCNENPGNGLDLGLVLSLFTGMDSTCNSALGDRIASSKSQQVFALIGAGVVASYVDTDQKATALVALYCSVERFAPELCRRSNAAITQWVAKFIPAATIQSGSALGQAALQDLRQLNIEIMQYGRNVVTNQFSMLRRPIFFNQVNAYDLAAWGLMADWITGTREVFSVQGDVGTITVVTSKSNSVTTAMNSMEVPVNVAFCVRSVCLYITGVLVGVALLSLVLAVGSRFHVEGSNFFKLNRVAGIVWVGRPLLLVRSLSALCLLSTGSLQLSAFGAVSALVSTTPPWYTVVLASGEVGWLVYIVNDVTMAYTKHATPRFTNGVGLVSWAAAAVLSLAWPVSPTATIHRDCAVVQTDMQMVCVSAAVFIGDVARFGTLVAISVGLSLAGVVVSRCRHDAADDVAEHQSHLLPAGAKYLFLRPPWVHNRTFYIDAASAVVAGMVAVQVRGFFYVFDVKSWRTLVVPAHHQGLEDHPNGAGLKRALPLVQ